MTVAAGVTEIFPSHDVSETRLGKDSGPDRDSGGTAAGVDVNSLNGPSRCHGMGRVGVIMIRVTGPESTMTVTVTVGPGPRPTELASAPPPRLQVGRIGRFKFRARPGAALAGCASGLQPELPGQQ